MLLYKKKEETLCGTIKFTHNINYTRKGEVVETMTATIYTYVYKIRYTKWNGKQVVKGRIRQDIPQLDPKLYDEEIRQLRISAQEQYNLAKYKFMIGDYDYKKETKKETEE